MPRHLGIRKRKELKKGGSVSNVDKLADDFAREVQMGKSGTGVNPMNPLTPQGIKKKFSI